MKIQTQCVQYENAKPDTSNLEGGPPVFIIPKETIESLIEIGLKLVQIANLLCVSESMVYRRMRQYRLSTVDFITSSNRVGNPYIHIKFHMLI